jgi:hypothetical protein
MLSSLLSSKPPRRTPNEVTLEEITEGKEVLRNLVVEVMAMMES